MGLIIENIVSENEKLINFNKEINDCRLKR